MKTKIIILLSPLIICIVAMFCAWGQTESIDLSLAKLPPSFSHFFGTDLLGRDVFLRILNSFKVSLFVGIGSSSLALLFAIFFVLVSRFYCKNLAQRIIDIFLAIPSLMIVMFVQSLTFGNLWVMIFVIALGHWAVIAKVLANEMDRLCNQDFYLCAIVLGASKWRALCFEVLPACFHLLLILWILNIAHSIGNEATLSFFGLGIEPTKASLGNMLSDSSKAIFVGGWWMVVFPVLAMMCLILPLISCANVLQNYWGVRK